MKRVLFMATLVISMAASADVMDRINACESAGGGACVFDLLRELASNASHAEPFGGLYQEEEPKSEVFCDAHQITPNHDGNKLVGFTMECTGYSELYSCTNNYCRSPKGFQVSVISASRYTIYYGGYSANFKRTL